MTFGGEFVVLHTTPSIIGKFLVHPWSWCGCLNKEHFLDRSIEGKTLFGMPRGAIMNLQ